MAELHELKPDQQAATVSDPWLTIGDTGLDYDGSGRVRDEWLDDLRGERAPYPNWIGLSAGETVNCQCILVPEV